MNDEIINSYFYFTKSPFLFKQMTRSRCEWLLKNSRMINDWNNVVEKLLLEKQKPKRKRKRKKILIKKPSIIHNEHAIFIKNF